MPNVRSSVCSVCLRCQDGLRKRFFAVYKEAAEFSKGSSSNSSPESVAALSGVSDDCEPVTVLQSSQLPSFDDICSANIPPLAEPGISQSASFAVRSRARCIDILNHVVDSDICTNTTATTGNSQQPMMMFLRDLAMFACPSTSSCKMVTPCLTVQEMTLPTLTCELHLSTPKLCCLEPVDVDPFPTT